MISEELAPFLAQSGALSDLGYHTGRVVSFDLTTGSNVVEVAGTPLTDLPLFNIGDAVNLDAGDTVALLRFKSTMFILGRVVLPGAGALYSGALFAFSESIATSGFALSTTGATEIISDVRTTPAWANAIIIYAALHGTGRNDRGAQDYMRIRVTMDLGGATGDGGEIFAQGDPSPNPSYATASASWAQAGLLAPGSLYTIGGKIRSTNGAWTAHADNHLDLTYTVINTKV